MSIFCGVFLTTVSNTFICGDGNIIDSQNVCNNEYQCFDESDEYPVNADCLGEYKLLKLQKILKGMYNYTVQLIL